MNIDSEMATFSDYPPVFNFDTTDDFLQTLSEGIPNLSPSLFAGEDNQSLRGGAGLENQEQLDPNIDYMNPNMNNNPYNISNNEVSPTSNGWEQLSQVYLPQQLQIQQDQQVQEQNIQQQQQQQQQQAQQQQDSSTSAFSNVVQPLFNTSYIQNDRKSSSMSTTNSTSHSLTSNVLSPASQNSISSTHTSPEYVHIKQEGNPVDELKMNAKSTTNALSKVTKPSKKDKCSHNMIEKKYRTNINSKILALRDAVPSLRIATGDSKDISITDLEGLTPASKLNKASVLTKATEYIKHLEKKNDILKNQNLELQRIIQEANVGSSGQHQQHVQYDNRGNGMGGFGFVPGMNEQSYNTTVNNNVQSFAGGNNMYRPNQHQQQMHHQPQQIPNQLSTGQKVLLGGLATVMGSSMFANGGGMDGDFKGLSGLPFIPYALSHPSKLTLQACGMLKNLILFGAIINIIYPLFIAKHLADPQDEEEDEGSSKVRNASLVQVWRDYFYINFGFQLPNVIDQKRKSEIISKLNGKANKPVSYIKLINDYVYLSSCELTFENCFLNILVGKILISKYPILSSFLEYNMSLKASIIINLEYKGDDIYLIKLNQLIHDLDGVAIFGSEGLFKRLMNILEHNSSINAGCNDGLNRLKYVELYQEQFDNYYGIIFSWRILELTHQINLKYLETLGSKDLEDEVKQSVYQEIENDTEKINKLLKLKKKQNGGAEVSKKLTKYFNLFKTTIKPEVYGFELRKQVQKDVERCLVHFRSIQGHELADSATLLSQEEEKGVAYEDKDVPTKENNNEYEIASEGEVDDDELELEEEDYEDEVEEEYTHNENKLTNQKSLISSLNLITQDQFIILTSSLVLYYYPTDPEQAAKLMGYFSFQTDAIDMSFLSFTLLLKVIMKVSADCNEHNEVLDQLIRIVKIWINDESRKNVLDLRTIGNLSNIVVEKGLLLNGIKEDGLEDN